MLISNATVRALDELQARERDVLQAYAPGAVPERGDVAQPQAATRTLDALSAAPPQDAYFITADERGRLLFSRDGSFRLQQGALVDERGLPVQGFRSEGSSLAPLCVDPVDAALGIAQNASIQPDGLVTYERSVFDPRTGRREMQRATLGRIGLARFAAGSKLQAVDPQHVAAPSGVTPHVGNAGDGNFGAIAPFARAGSGIDLDVGLERLQQAYLTLDAIRAAGTAQDGVEKTTMDLLK